MKLIAIVGVMLFVLGSVKEGKKSEFKVSQSLSFSRKVEVSRFFFRLTRVDLGKSIFFSNMEK